VRRWTTWLAWGLWALDIAVVVALLTIGDGDDGAWGTAGGVLFIVIFATTGAMVASRVPANPIGWLLCLAALAFSIGGVCVGISEQAARTDQDGFVVTGAAWVGTFVWLLGLGPAATFVLLLFPDGRLPSRRWRPVAWLAASALVLAFLGVALAPGLIEDTNVSNPFGVPGGGRVLEVVAGIGLGLILVSILASCASLVARYRRAAAEQRQQLKWLAWSVPVVLAWLAASIGVGSDSSSETAVDVSNALASTGLAIVPFSIGVGILRHRLYDIDVVIKRTLVYGALTALLVGTYLGSVLVFRLVLNPVTGESDLAVAASTLAVAALFRPLRSRVQGVVDRRFYRRRYDAARTLEGFSGRLRHELDLETLATDLRVVVNDTMQPTQVSLWLRSQP